jgi:hypothetical protein
MPFRERERCLCKRETETARERDLFLSRWLPRRVVIPQDLSCSRGGGARGREISTGKGTPNVVTHSPELRRYGLECVRDAFALRRHAKSPGLV